MKTIHKFELSTYHGWHEVEMPTGSVPLSVGFQGGRLFLWARVDDSRSKATKRFFTALTGAEVPPWLRLIGRAQIDGPPPFVVHVFE